MNKTKYYLTTPIYYANSRPHVGSAYTTIVCDVIARHKRMTGFDVAYLTGTDEHGVNIERAAEKAGISPAELVDRNQKIFRRALETFGDQLHAFHSNHFDATCSFGADFGASDAEAIASARFTKRNTKAGTASTTICTLATRRSQPIVPTADALES